MTSLTRSLASIASLASKRDLDLESSELSDSSTPVTNPSLTSDSDDEDVLEAAISRRGLGGRLPRYEKEGCGLFQPGAKSFVGGFFLFAGFFSFFVFLFSLPIRRGHMVMIKDHDLFCHGPKFVSGSRFRHG